MQHTHQGDGGPTHEHEVNGDHVHVIVRQLDSGQFATAWNYQADHPDVQAEPHRFTGGMDPR